MPQSSRGSPIGDALVWSSRIMALGLMMFLPGVAGNWLDARLGTRFLGPVGLVLGFAVVLVLLVQIGRTGTRR
jgi:hypothetical protein